MRAVFEQHAHPIAQSLTRENLHARIRGLLMMAESNDTGALLISCGNETEIALGYATLYGDMCGGISLIGDLSKTRRLPPRRATSTRKHGARDDPRRDVHDQAVGGARRRTSSTRSTTAVVAPIVGELVERRTSPAELVAPVRARARSIRRGSCRTPRGARVVRQAHGRRRFRGVVDDAFRRMRRSVYKRLQGPPIVVVSERAFGFDLRETIINGWEG